MPAHDSLGPDDAQGIKNARVATIEPDEQGAVDPTQMQSTARRTLLQDVELMPQYQDFGFQRINRQLSEWNLPPLVIRAFGALCQNRTHAPQQMMCTGCNNLVEKSIIILKVRRLASLAFVAVPKCNPLSDATTTSL